MMIAPEILLTHCNPEGNQEPCGKTTGYEKRKSLNCVSNAHFPSTSLGQSSEILLFLLHPAPTGQDATIVAL